MDFKTLLKKHLTAAQFEQLPELMGITQTRCTQILNDPPRMTQVEIKTILFILNVPEITPDYLITDFKCGTKILTIDQSTKLIENWQPII
ncbi:MAG: hypothetical protein WCP32_10275 [Bacteroidota bacterium]